MAKNKKNDMDSFSGMFLDDVTEQKKEIILPKKNTNKAGRPKVKRETKKRYTITLLPSVYKKAAGLADIEQKSISEFIENLIKMYE